MKMRFICSLLVLVSLIDGGATWAATSKAKSQRSVMQSGTGIRERVPVSGLYDQACYDAYYGCMDQFCLLDDVSNKGSCVCSNDNEKFEKELVAIRQKLDEADRIKNIEVEKINAGAKADIIFNGKRRYDENGNVIEVDQAAELIAQESKTQAQRAQERREKLDALFNKSIYDDDDEDVMDLIATKKGSELFSLLEQICIERIPETCDRDVQLLRQVYARQIVADCKQFENYVEDQRNAADLAMANADAAVREALKNSFDNANKLNLGECMVAFKECMTTEDTCGSDWSNCVSIIASENMQNNAAKSVAGEKVETIETFDITTSTMDRLQAKRDICEGILDSCMAVRNEVWPKFLRDVAPTIKSAELAAESKMRQSCLVDISDCIRNACRDNIANKNVDSMDACLARPDMVRSFCKLEIDKCERMEPQIWGYVTDKLAAMRVDACTQEVKDCITDENRCGKDFQNCIGMDFEYIHDICPIDKLVVCKQTNPNFSMDDLDSMLMGLYLNIDNAALAQCQKLVDDKMLEICGSTDDCNRFAADNDIGTHSLRSQKDGDKYRVTGMISFGSIKMGDAAGTVYDNVNGEPVLLGPGQLGVQGYIDEIISRNSTVENMTGIVSAIEEELNNIAGTINRTIEMIAQDPQIQFCITGRNLDQITGVKTDDRGRKVQNNMTSARFPNLLNQTKMQIAIAALRKAQDNYNEKFNHEIAEATRNASADIAQYMCQKIAMTGSDGGGLTGVDTPLAPPYAISYEVGEGLDREDLVSGGMGQSSFTSKYGSGMNKEVTSIFNRETRNCHVCTVITDQSCKIKGGNWFRKKNTTCDVETRDPICEDIPM